MTDKYYDALVGDYRDLKTSHDALLKALEGLMENYDPERGVIDVDPEPSCIECTAGTTPNHLNKGPCEYPKALAAVKAARGTGT